MRAKDGQILCECTKYLFMQAAQKGSHIIYRKHFASQWLADNLTDISVKCFYIYLN